MTLRRYAAVNHAFIALASSRFSTVSNGCDVGLGESFLNSPGEPGFREAFDVTVLRSHSGKHLSGYRLRLGGRGVPRGTP